MNLEERPFAVYSLRLHSRAPQRAVHPRQLAVRAERGRAHAERAQVIRCSNEKNRQAQVIVTMAMPISGETTVKCRTGVFLGLTFRRRFLYAAAVAVVAAAHWSSYRRALTLSREAVTSLQNVHQVLCCRGGGI